MAEDFPQPRLSVQLPGLFHQYGRPHRFQAGQLIFLKGSPAEKIYYLERGHVRAYLLYPDGEERTLCFVEQENMVGEEALAEPYRRIVCADAAADALLYEMDGRTLCRLCGDCLPELMSFFMKKITLLSSRIFYTQFTRNEEKVACLLYSETAESPAVWYTHEQIAAVTGMSRVSASKILSALAEQGLVSQQYKKIRVLDRPALLEIFREKEFY